MKFLFVVFQYLIPQHSLSRLAGKLAECEWPWLKNRLIKWFIAHYDVDMTEAEQNDYRQYPHFNAFFTRALRSDVRTIDNAADSIVSPADGSISEIGRIDRQTLLQAKNWYYRLDQLLADPASAERFRNGHFATIYLSPRDYHRVHMPVAGKLRSMTYVPGDLFSVNDTSASSISNLFARNERVVCLFDTAFGEMALILVGAVIVAGIETRWAGQVAPPNRRLQQTDYSQPSQPELAKGEEMGRFKLGSTAIVLFTEGQAEWLQALQHGDAVRLGEVIGQGQSGN